MARIPPSDRFRSADGTDSDSADSGSDGGTETTTQEPTRREQTVTETEPEPVDDPDIDGGTAGGGGDEPAPSRREETVTETEPEPADDPDIPDSTDGGTQDEPAPSRREETVTETEPEPADDPDIPDSGTDTTESTTQPPDDAFQGAQTDDATPDEPDGGGGEPSVADERGGQQPPEGTGTTDREVRGETGQRDPLPPTATMSEREQQVVDQFVSESEDIQREDIADVEQTGEEGEYRIEFTEAYAVDQFVEESETYDREDIAGAERTDDGWAFNLTDEGQTTRLRETTDRASQSVSLGTTGLGTTGTRQSRLEENTPRASESVSLGTDALGTTDDQIDDTEAAREGVQRDEEMVAEIRQEQVEADVRNELREQVEEQLREQGANPENFEITVTETDDGRIQAGAERTEEAEEQFGDTGFLPQGVEEWSRDAGEDISNVIDENVPEGAVAIGSLPITVASSVSDQAGATTSRVYQGAFRGGAEVLNVPQTAVTFNELAELGVYGASETAKGQGGEFVEDVSEAAEDRAAMVESQAKENPARFAGMVGGGLVASTLTLGGAASTSSRLGTVARYAVQPGEEILKTGARVTYRGARGVPSKVDNVRSRVDSSEFLGDDRAQAQIPGGRQVDSDDAGSADADQGDLMDPDTADEVRQAERNELARQAQEQAEYQVEQEYGEQVRDSVPEVDDSVTKQTRAADDIQRGAQRGGDPRVASGEDISFEENFNRAIRQNRQQESTVLDELNPELGSARARRVYDEVQQARMDATPSTDLRTRYGVEEPRVTPEMDARSNLEASGEAAVRSVTGEEVSESPMLGQVDAGATTESVAAREVTGEAAGESDAVSELERAQESETTAEETLELGQEATQEFEGVSDTRQEFRLDTRQEQSVDTEVETEVETESRVDTRSEFRFDSRSEGRRRFDIDLDGGGGPDDEVFAGDPGGQEQQLRYDALDLL